MSYLLPYQCGPIETHTLDSGVMDDLELINKGAETSASLADALFAGCSTNARSTWNTMAGTFSSDRQYLIDTQNMLQTYQYDPTLSWIESDSYLELHRPLAENEAFETQYQYLDLDFVKWANHNPIVCRLLVLSNYTAPVLNTLLPFISVLIIMMVRYLRDGTISISDFKTIVWETLGKRVVGFISAPTLTGKLYGLFIAVMYFTNIYANVRSCIKFKKSFVEIEKYLDATHAMISASLAECERQAEAMDNLETYEPYCDQLSDHFESLSNAKASMETALSESGGKRSKGPMYTAFYKFVMDPILVATCNVGTKILAYGEILWYMCGHISSGKMNYCKYSSTRHTQIKDFRHPTMSPDASVGNTISLDKNISITGPNASGKTTVIKAVLINSLLSQQFGVGAYRTAKIRVANGFHSYLNVPDTADRDSLFQAEARRCKTILDTLENSSGYHLCLFDELYSGTNPYEATGATIAYLSYVSKRHPNVRFLLTTHLVDVCHRLKASNKNMMMHGTIEGDVHRPTYKLNDGVSTVRSGYIVLKDLGYPADIVDQLNSFAHGEK